MKYLCCLWMSFLLLPLQAQQTAVVNFKTCRADISLFPKRAGVEGKISYSFTLKKKADSIYLDARNVRASLAESSSLKAALHTTAKKIWLVYPFKAGKTYTVSFNYQINHPKKTLYFIGWHNAGSNQIWSQGEGHHTSYWLPSIDDKNDKIIFTITYRVPKAYTVIGNGQLTRHDTVSDQGVWTYQMKHPMSSYLVAVAVGNYRKKILHASDGTPIELYYEPQFAEQVEPTYRYSKKIFDFLEKEIGVPYPWTNYKQVPVRNFLYAGMENTTLTIFAESLFTDSIGFIDRNYVNVNAHELAHQWFGDAVTESSGKSHWLQEGFATYYALLAERKIFGDEYFYQQLFKYADQLKSQSDKGKGHALTDPHAGSLTFYQKGAWALHILREKIGGKAFKKGIRDYLQAYKFQNVTTADFITKMEQASGQDLTRFTARWIHQKAFQGKDALQSLRKSPAMVKFLDLAALREQPLSQKYPELDKALDFPVDQYFGQEVVHQLAKEPPSEKRLKLYKKAFATHNILVRQAIALTLKKIPATLQKDYESLLQDASYLTREKALFHLWTNFPQNRKAYLDRLQGVQGFYDKNVRLMWLTLALVTPDYHPSKNSDYFKELSQYAGPAYDYAIRQNAFGHLYQIDTFNDQDYQSLLEACTSPVWRFRKFSRQLLDKLVKEKIHRENLTVLSPLLPEKEKKILEKAMNKQKNK